VYFFAFWTLQCKIVLKMGVANNVKTGSGLFWLYVCPQHSQCYTAANQSYDAKARRLILIWKLFFYQNLPFNRD